MNKIKNQLIYQHSYNITMQIQKIIENKQFQN